MHKESDVRMAGVKPAICEVVKLLRSQMYFEGNKHLRDLIGELEPVSAYILENRKDEMPIWLTMLQALLQAQGNGDYVLIADVLEGELWPFLEGTWEPEQEGKEVYLTEYWEENISCLETADKKLCDRIVRECLNENADDSLQFEPLLAKCGQLTLAVRNGEETFCIHSTLEPTMEAKALIEGVEKSAINEYTVLGMGLGYHVKAFLDTNAKAKVTVLEHRIESLYLALTYLDWTSYIANGKLRIVYESDELALLKHLQEIKKEAVFFLHYPSLRCISNSQIREKLEDFFVTVSSMREQKHYLEENFAYLQRQGLEECSKLRTYFQGKKVVIVAGGPSVDDEIESIKKYREEITVFAVGTIVRKLLANEICPDVIVITDPQETMYKQVKDLDLAKTPLILLSTASKSVLEYYNGPVFLAYQDGYDMAEKVAAENGYTLFQTGGSVTTTALDISIQFGADEIILVGADLAFTNNLSHAKGVGRVIEDNAGLREVLSVTGGVVYTSKNLDIYRKWIERRIEGLRTPVIYNTSRGARIAGTVEKRLADIIKRADL